METASKNKCQYCVGKNKFLTNHQASLNHRSSAFIIGDSLIVQSFIGDTCTGETNVDISFCPFCGRVLTLPSNKKL